MSKAAARIRLAAIELFAAKGYGATSTRDIAASLDLSPGAVYPHYKTKEALLFAISLEGHTNALDAVKHVVQPLDTPTERLASAVTAYVTWHAENRDLARVVQYELRSLSPEHFATIANLRRATSRIFKRIINDGNASGEFNTLDVEAATLAITSLGVDVSRWFPSQAFSDPSTLAHRYVELALRVVGRR
jgi:AcrR family transcriptional regulator